MVALIGVKGDERAAEKWVKALAPAFMQQQLTPDRFLSMETELAGDLLLGRTDDGREVGLTWEELNRHVYISGQSGFGKSVTLKNLFLEAERRSIHAIHIDRKGDLEHTARDGVLNIHWTELRLNPLEWTGDVYEYRNEFAKLFCDCMQFFQRGLSVFLVALDTLFSNAGAYEGALPPTLSDLLRLFTDIKFRKRVRGQGMESLLSISDKLESLVVELEPIVSCRRGFDFRRLYTQGRAVNINLDGISVEYQNFLIVVLMLQYAHFFKANGPRDQLNMLLMFDEAKGLLGKQQQNFTIKDLFSKVRELGIGVVCADQIPSEMSQFLFSNVGTVVMFRHSDGTDLQRLRFSMGLSPEQVQENYSLQPGQCIVRLMKSKDLHKINVPFTSAEKFISRDELKTLMSTALEELYRDVVDEDEQPTKQRSLVDQLDPADRAFLECLARNFERPSSEVYAELGLGDSQGFRIKERLLSRKFISQFQTNLGKEGKRAVLLVPNPFAFEALGLQLPAGRGGALHKSLQQRIAALGEKLGFKAVVEDTSGSSEGCDVGLHRDGLRIAIEICITSRPSTEVQNIGKNVKTHDRVILSFINTAFLDKTRELAAASYGADVLKNVRFCLVNQLADVVKELA